MSKPDLIRVIGDLPCPVYLETTTRDVLGESAIRAAIRGDWGQVRIALSASIAGARHDPALAGTAVFIALLLETYSIESGTSISPTATDHAVKPAD